MGTLRNKGRNQTLVMLTIFGIVLAGAAFLIWKEKFSDKKPDDATPATAKPKGIHLPAPYVTLHPGKQAEPVQAGKPKKRFIKIFQYTCPHCKDSYKKVITPLLRDPELKGRMEFGVATLLADPRFIALELAGRLVAKLDPQGYFDHFLGAIFEEQGRLLGTLNKYMALAKDLKGQPPDAALKKQMDEAVLEAVGQQVEIIKSVLQKSVPGIAERVAGLVNQYTLAAMQGKQGQENPADKALVEGILQDIKGTMDAVTRLGIQSVPAYVVGDALVETKGHEPEVIKQKILQ